MRGKIIVLLSVLCLLMVTLLVAADTEAQCKDSDVGKDYGTKGALTNNGELFSVDSCQIKSGPYSYLSNVTCEGENCYLEEGYCDSPQFGEFRSFYYHCPTGCVNGVCATPTQPGCIEGRYRLTDCDDNGVCYGAEVCRDDRFINVCSFMDC